MEWTILSGWNVEFFMTNHEIETQTENEIPLVGQKYKLKTLRPDMRPTKLFSQDLASKTNLQVCLNFIWTNTIQTEN